MHHYVIFRRSDGAIIRYGWDQARQDMLAQADDEHDVLETVGPANRTEQRPSLIHQPDGSTIEGTVAVAVTHWPAVHGLVLAKIDADAQALTADPFEAVHAAKLAEARGGSKPESDRPLLAAEAKATGQKLGDLIAEVIRKGAEAEDRRNRIEVRRIAAKRAVQAMTDPRAIKAAVAVDWEG